MRYVVALMTLVVGLFGAAAVGATEQPVDDADAARLPVVEVVNTDTANFGVPYDDGGVLVIQYVGDNAGRQAVEARLSPDLQIRWELVKYSRGELKRVASEISALKLQGVF